VNVGDCVRIYRAGDVIPYVPEVVEKRSEGTYVFPRRVRSVTPPSSARRAARVLYRRARLSGTAGTGGRTLGATGRDDIEGLGPERVQQLREAGLVESLPDLYDLAVDDLAALEGGGARRAPRT